MQRLSRQMADVNNLAGALDCAHPAASMCGFRLKRLGISCALHMV